MKLFRLIILVSAIFFTNCTSFNYSQLNDLDIHDDSDYLDILKPITKSSTAYNHFENVYKITATHMTSSLEKALTIRSKNSLSPLSPIWDGFKKDYIGFMVSLSSPTHKLLDLNEVQLWTIQLNINMADNDSKNSRLPLRVQPLRRKEQISPYFLEVSSWSRDFLVIFAAPINEKGELANWKSLDLSFSIPQIKTSFQFPKVSN